MWRWWPSRRRRVLEAVPGVIVCARFGLTLAGSRPGGRVTSLARQRSYQENAPTVPPVSPVPSLRPAPAGRVANSPCGLREATRQFSPSPGSVRRHRRGWGTQARLRHRPNCRVGGSPPTIVPHDKCRLVGNELPTLRVATSAPTNASSWHRWRMRLRLIRSRSLNAVGPSTAHAPSAAPTGGGGGRMKGLRLFEPVGRVREAPRPTPPQGGYPEGARKRAVLLCLAFLHKQESRSPAGARPGQRSSQFTASGTIRQTNRRNAPTHPYG